MTERAIDISRYRSRSCSKGRANPAPDLSKGRQAGRSVGRRYGNAPRLCTVSPPSPARRDSTRPGGDQPLGAAPCAQQGLSTLAACRSRLHSSLCSCRCSRHLGCGGGEPRPYSGSLLLEHLHISSWPVMRHAPHVALGLDVHVRPSSISSWTIWRSPSTLQRVLREAFLRLQIGRCLRVDQLVGKHRVLVLIARCSV